MKEKAPPYSEQEWLFFLKDHLEIAGFMLDVGQHLQLQKLFALYGVSSKDHLYAIRNRIIPILAKNAEEQDRLKQAFEGFYEEKQKKQTSGQEEADTSPHKKNRLITDFVFAAVFICFIGLMIYLNRSTSNSISAITHKDSVVNKEQDSGKKQSKNDSINRDTCNLIADFNYQIGIVELNSNDRNPEGMHALIDSYLEVFFKNTTQGDLDCIKRVKWDFGDEHNLSLNSAKDTSHNYKKPGTYKVTMTVFDKKEKPHVMSKNVRVINFTHFSLPTIAPLYARMIPVNTVYYWIAISVLAILLTVFLAWLVQLTDILFKRRQEGRLRRSFRIKSRGTGRVSYDYPSKSQMINFGGLPSSAVSYILKSKEYFLNRIDVPKTIYSSISRAGFPTVKFLERSRLSDVVVLIESNGSENQQEALFDDLLSKIRYKGLDLVRFYYSDVPTYLRKDKKIDKFLSLADVAKEYSHASLIILGSGYPFLNQYASLGHEAPGNVFRLIRKWQKRVLITPVPRNNWSTYERELFRNIKIYPATSDSIETALREISVSIKSPPARYDNTDYINYPIKKDIRAYETYFREDRRLLTWLYALSLAERQDWSVTIAVGRALEQEVFKESSHLVSYNNLLKLTSVEWLQSGMLDSNHKSEMLAELKKEVNGEEIIKTAAHCMAELSKEIKVEEGTVLALQKRVQEKVLEQWSTDTTDNEIAFFYKYNLLDNFNSKQLSKHIRFANASVLKKRRPMFVLIGMAVLAFFIYLFNSNPVSSKTLQSYFHPKYVVGTDSFVYYNNAAAGMMARTDSSHLAFDRTVLDTIPKNLVTTRELLTKASKINDTSAIVEQNERILNYKIGSYLYNQQKYKQALLLFKEILSKNIGEVPYRKDTLRIYADIGKINCYYLLKVTDYFLYPPTYLKQLESNNLGIAPYIY